MISQRDGDRAASRARWRLTPTLPAGEPANLTVFDPDQRWQVVPAELASKSRNTPFVGVDLRGKVRRTLLGGRVTAATGFPQ